MSTPGEEKQATQVDMAVWESFLRHSSYPTQVQVAKPNWNAYHPEEKQCLEQLQGMQNIYFDTVENDFVCGEFCIGVVDGCYESGKKRTLAEDGDSRKKKEK